MKQERAQYINRFNSFSESRQDARIYFCSDGEVSTGSGSDRVLGLAIPGGRNVETRSLPLPVLTSLGRKPFPNRGCHGEMLLP